eukprot:m.137179 g.137179  ORF g.137179 m.137179 type:complete len:956 (-) comp9921_c0_seq2:136-3003(-)
MRMRAVVLAAAALASAASASTTGPPLIPTSTPAPSSTTPLYEQTVVRVAAAAALLLVVAMAAACIFFCRRRRAPAAARERDVEMGQLAAPARPVMEQWVPAHAHGYTHPPSEYDALLADITANEAYHKISRKKIKVLENIGTGLYGEIFHGHFEEFAGQDPPTEVVLKCLFKTKSEVSRIKQLQDAAIGNQFRHPNVIKLLGIVLDTTPIVVKEYAARGPLDRHLRRARPSRQILFSMSRDIAAGLDYLSCCSFILGDLAARHILVARDYSCKIGGFGLSRDVSDQTNRVEKLEIKWAAPELYPDSNENADAEAALPLCFTTQTDVWCFGVVLYEIWSYGDLPWGKLSDAKVMATVREGHRMAPPHGCPRDVYRAMIKCWHPDSRNRPSFAHIRLVMAAGADGEIEDTPPATEITKYPDLQNSYLDEVVVPPPTPLAFPDDGSSHDNSPRLGSTLLAARPDNVDAAEVVSDDLPGHTAASREARAQLAPSPPPGDAGLHPHSGRDSPDSDEPLRPDSPLIHRSLLNLASPRSSFSLETEPIPPGVLESPGAVARRNLARFQQAMDDNRREAERARTRREAERARNSGAPAFTSIFSDDGAEVQLRRPAVVAREEDVYLTIMPETAATLPRIRSHALRAVADSEQRVRPRSDILNVDAFAAGHTRPRRGSQPSIFDFTRDSKRLSSPSQLTGTPPLRRSSDSPRVLKQVSLDGMDDADVDMHLSEAERAPPGTELAVKARSEPPRPRPSTTPIKVRGGKKPRGLFKQSAIDGDPVVGSTTSLNAPVDGPVSAPAALTKSTDAPTNEQPELEAAAPPSTVRHRPRWALRLPFSRRAANIPRDQPSDESDPEPLSPEEVEDDEEPDERVLERVAAFAESILPFQESANMINPLELEEPTELSSSALPAIEVTTAPLGLSPEGHRGTLLPSDDIEPLPSATPSASPAPDDGEEPLIAAP